MKVECTNEPEDNTVLFRDLNVGECFLDADGDLMMKVCRIGDQERAVWLENGEFVNYTGNEVVTLVASAKVTYTK